MGEVDQVTEEFLSLLEGLSCNDWELKVDESRTIKDVVAHLIGWERECAVVLGEKWSKKEPAWFLKSSDYESFNNGNIQKYASYSCAELIGEWKAWQEQLVREIDKIGEENLRQYPELFSWVFDEGENGHYLTHLNQVKETLDKGTE